MSRSFTDSLLETIQPATVADHLVVAALPREVLRAVKAALYEEIEDEIGYQSRRIHNHDLQVAEEKVAELRKAILEIKETVLTAESGDEKRWQEVIDRVQQLVDETEIEQ
jgi:hypothetical protein